MGDMIPEIQNFKSNMSEDNRQNKIKYEKITKMI